MSITLRRTGGCPPLVDADGHAFCQAIYKGSEVSDWEELTDHYWTYCWLSAHPLQRAVHGSKISH